VKLFDRKHRPKYLDYGIVFLHPDFRHGWDDGIQFYYESESIPWTPDEIADKLAKSASVLTAQIFNHAWNGGFPELMYDFGSFAAEVCYYAGLHVNTDWVQSNLDHYLQGIAMLKAREPFLDRPIRSGRTGAVH
jgi:hypothetical protein